jgi:DNA-binding transcriptional LysR family regulator
MNIRSIDLNLLVAFDALFDERSVSKAADRLALTQPTVSGMLKKLRYVFADDLFVRTSHGILPTPRSEALATPVKELLIQAQSLVRPEEFDPADSKTTIRICGSDYLQQAVISPLINKFRTLAPKVRISVMPRPAAGLLDLMARGEMDLCVSAREVAIPDLPARKLFSDRFVCVARRAHPLNHQISLRELSAYDHILVDPTQGRFTGPMDDALAEMGRQRRVAAVVPSFSMLFDALESSDYLAFIPERLFNNRSERFKLLTVEIDAPPIEIVANWHPRMNRDARHQWLRKQLVDVSRLA